MDGIASQVLYIQVLYIQVLYIRTSPIHGAEKTSMIVYGRMHDGDHAWAVRRTYAPHRQQCLSPRQRWRSSTSSTSTLFFPSHHPLHVSHITAMPEKNVCRYLNKVDSRGRACVTITRYTCILDVTLDPPKRVDFYPNYEIHFLLGLSFTRPQT